MKAHPKPRPEGQLVLDFEDNRLLSSLFGFHDQNLARIEHALDVSIVSRGNRVVVRGQAGACQTARQALHDLYQRLEQGQVIDLGDVDGAVTMAQAEANRIAPKPRPGNGRDTATKPVDTKPWAGRRAETRPSKGRERPSQKPAAPGDDNVVAIHTRTRSIVPRTPRQAEFMMALLSQDLVFGVGPAGTGKTYLAVATAVAKMVAGEIDRIILSRPAVEAGENLGFLPGDLRDKVDPYLRPLYDALYDMMPAEQVERRLANGQIEIAPLAYMRGRTLKNAFVILDEAQNTTPVQMKMFLTRFGENARMAVCGDASQVDLPLKQQSGLPHALKILNNVPGVAIIQFGEEDVVRHPLVSRIVNAYEREESGS